MPIDPSVLLKAQPVDVAAGVQEGATANLASTRAQDVRMQLEDTQQTNQALKDYLSVDGADLYTSKGIEEAMPKLKGRIPPKAYLELGAARQKALTAEAQYQASLGNLNTTQLKSHTDNIEAIMELVGPLADFKGSPEEWPAYLSTKLDAAAGQVGPTGAPLISPNEIANAKKLPQDTFKQLYAASKSHKSMVDTAYKEAETKRQEAQTNVLDEGGPQTHWTTPAGDDVLVSKSGRVNKIDPSTGDWVTLPALPPGSYKSGAKNPAGPPVDEAKKLAPEDLQWIAAYEQQTGKPIPGIPVGMGAAAGQARQEYLKAFVKMAKERGYSGGDAGQLALVRDASKEAIKQRTTQNAAIEAGERDLIKVGDTIKEELTKLGGPSSPLVRKYWNKAATVWAGDPAFSGLNAALVNYKETAARVYSGQSGAGGTPVTYLKLAESSIGENPTLEQFSKTTETMNKLFEARKASNEGTIKGLLGTASMTPKPGSDAAVSKDEQAARDTDATNIKRSELKKARDKYRSEKDPDAKARLADDIKALEKELGSKAEAEPVLDAKRKADLKAKYGL